MADDAYAASVMDTNVYIDLEIQEQLDSLLKKTLLTINMLLPILLL